ncbi:uncharacterized protein ISCGN_022712 [Ixodes scapularis]
MALSRPRNPSLRDEDDGEFWIAFAQLQTTLAQRKLELAHVRAEIDNARRKRKRAEERCDEIRLLVLSATREREVWEYPRPPSWYETTLPSLPESFFKANFRVSRATFSYVVSACSRMQREDTNMRRAIPLHKRVAIGMYRLATSAEDRTVGNLFGVSRSSVSMIFREFCDVILSELEPRFVRFPKPDQLEDHMQRFTAVTGFPQGVGALDGCHIEICPPKEYAADYHNYKGWYSMILLAVVDHNYRFLYVNVGSPGRNHDSAVFRKSMLPALIASDLFRVGTKQIAGCDVGPIILCDQAFPLDTHLMKPFPYSSAVDEKQQAFNSCLSGARRVVENAFGRMKARYRIVHKGLECSIENANKIVRTCVVLHNILLGRLRGSTTTIGQPNPLGRQVILLLALFSSSRGLFSRCSHDHSILCGFCHKLHLK